MSTSGYSTRFWDFVMSRPESLMKKQMWEKSYVCPGCQGHNHPRSDFLFEKYVGKGNKLYQLYWRTHPNEVFWDTKWKK